MTDRTITDDAMEAGDGDATLHLSVVIPVYNSAETLPALVTELETTLASRYRLEVVLVNDGSADGSGDTARALASTRPWLVVVDLARNFGEHNAVMAGLNQCTGDVAVIMDDDLQNPPSEVITLVEHLCAADHDVVFARYGRKRHGLLRNLGSRLNNLMASWLLGKPRDLYLCSFKAVRRFIIDEVVKYRGPHPYVDGLILRTTRRWSAVDVTHAARATGRSGYTLRKLMSLWLNMFTSFSVAPLRLASILGLSFSAVGFVLAVIFAIEKIQNPALAAGWASTICTVLIVGGVQLFAVGMIGEYLGRLFMKQNGAPQFVVREVRNPPASRRSGPTS